MGARTASASPRCCATQGRRSPSTPSPPTTARTRSSARPPTRSPRLPSAWPWQAATGRSARSPSRPPPQASRSRSSRPARRTTSPARVDLPLDLEAACAIAVRAARERPIDVLRAGDRPFLNAASVGLSVIAAHRARPFKRPLGPLAYAVGALRAGLTARPLRCHVRADGRQVFTGAAWQVIVAGTGAFGGGSELDAADPSDRLVDVAVLAAGPRVALIRRAWGLKTGGVTEQPGVHHARGTVIELELPAGTSFNVDGEVCSVAPARFCARGERVRVVVP